MIVSLIAAIDQAGGIGKEGGVPWRLSTDLQWFKNITMGHAIIIGRKTFESIGSYLQGRTNIILSRQIDFQPQGTWVVRSLEEALEFARSQGEEEVFVIGGGEVFAQSLPLADRLYLTRVNADFDCDIHFPPFNSQEWVIVKTENHPQSEKDQTSFTFQIFHRKP